MRNLNPQLLDKVFDFNGSLGTFSSRIDMARCLGLISDQLYLDIHLIRKLRNDAAHNWFDFKLTQARVNQFVAPIKSHIAFFDLDPETDPSAKEQNVDAKVKLSTLAMQLNYDRP